MILHIRPIVAGILLAVCFWCLPNAFCSTISVSCRFQRHDGKTYLDFRVCPCCVTPRLGRFLRRIQPGKRGVELRPCPMRQSCIGVRPRMEGPASH